LRVYRLNQFGGAAVLDKETGLVWEQSPSTAARTWLQALDHCYNKNVGGRKGWRLATVEELMSLVDPTQIVPSLSPGHPFDDVQPSDYWSATTNAGDTSTARSVGFAFGFLDGFDKSLSFRVWCVRGGQAHDGQ
jgi:hypothetical protein